MTHLRIASGGPTWTAMNLFRAKSQRGQTWTMLVHFGSSQCRDLVLGGVALAKVTAPTVLDGPVGPAHLPAALRPLLALVVTPRTRNL